jgi:hypothetical protein
MPLPASRRAAKAAGSSSAAASSGGGRNAPGTWRERGCARPAIQVPQVASQASQLRRSDRQEADG